MSFPFEVSGRARARRDDRTTSTGVGLKEIPEESAACGHIVGGDGVSRGGDVKQGRLNPAALPLPDAARILTRLTGREVSEVMLQADIASGAPTNPDGTLNVVHYTAWLVTQMQT